MLQVDIGLVLVSIVGSHCLPVCLSAFVLREIVNMSYLTCFSLGAYVSSLVIFPPKYTVSEAPMIAHRSGLSPTCTLHVLNVFRTRFLNAAVSKFHEFNEKVMKK